MRRRSKQKLQFILDCSITWFQNQIHAYNILLKYFILLLHRCRCKTRREGIQLQVPYKPLTSQNLKNMKQKDLLYTASV